MLLELRLHLNSFLNACRVIFVAMESEKLLITESARPHSFENFFKYIHINVQAYNLKKAFVLSIASYFYFQ